MRCACSTLIWAGSPSAIIVSNTVLGIRMATVAMSLPGSQYSTRMTGFLPTHQGRGDGGAVRTVQKIPTAREIAAIVRRTTVAVRLVFMGSCLAEGVQGTAPRAEYAAPARRGFAKSTLRRRPVLAHLPGSPPKPPPAERRAEGDAKGCDHRGAGREVEVVGGEHSDRAHDDPRDPAEREARRGAIRDEHGDHGRNNQV